MHLDHFIPQTLIFISLVNQQKIGFLYVYIIPNSNWMGGLETFCIYNVIFKKHGTVHFCIYWDSIQLINHVLYWKTADFILLQKSFSHYRNPLLVYHFVTWNTILHQFIPFHQRGCSDMRSSFLVGSPLPPDHKK